ncbi:ComEC/Rec2 family competence protein [Fodinicurvata halophila]
MKAVLLFQHFLAEERERWGLWLVVGLGSGIALYFSLPFEPWPYLFAVTLPATGIALMLGRRQRWQPAYPVFMLMMIVLGFHLAQVRTHMVAAPVLEKEMAAVSLVAEVIALEPVAGGVRLLLKPQSIEGLEEKMYPHYLRLVSRGDIPQLDTGSRVNALASLAPPPPAAVPGDYDFARNAYFKQIGAVGFTYGPPDVVTSQVSTEQVFSRGRRLQDTWQGWWNEQRQLLADTALSELPGQTGAVTAALLTGQRGAISEATNEAMRHSGLAHLLAISGLHLGLIAGTSFFVVRAFLCLWPAVALRWPVKKIAACCALAMAFCYLFLAGATIPTQRAFIMTGLVLLAVLLDRTALTLRLVGLAALLVLVLSPESLLGASFQMSFAAVTGLVAGYEILRERKASSGSDQDARGRLQKVSGYFLGVGITTVIATLATAPFALYHFNGLASYGLLANLVAVPLTAFWVMPAALLVLLATP